MPDEKLLGMVRGIVERGDLEGVPLDVLPYLARGSDEAMREAERLMALLRRHADSPGASAEFREGFFRTLAGMATGAEERDLLRRSLEAAEQAGRDDPVLLAGLLARHATIHEAAGRLDDAIVLRRRAVGLLVGGSRKALAAELTRLAEVLRAHGAVEEAATTAERACGLLRTPPDEALQAALSTLARSLEGLGRWEEEARACDELRALQQASPESLAGWCFQAAVARERLGRYAEALADYVAADRAWADFEQTWWGGTPPDRRARRQRQVAMVLGRSRCLAMTGRLAEAFREALQAPGALAVPLEATGLPGVGFAVASAARHPGVPGPQEELTWRALGALAARKGRTRLQEWAASRFRGV